jgi:V8-like Glu-specific endopeptidase
MDRETAEQVVQSPVEDALTVAAVLEYWSEDRLRSTQPLPIPESSAETFAMLPSTEPGVAVHADSLGPGGAFELASLWFTTSRVNDITVFPQCAVGKLYMTFGGSNFVGSAWVVAECAIFTAGHCLYDTEHGGWATNVIFKARYRNGQALGTWAFSNSKLAVPKGWYDNRDFTLDMGAAVSTTPIRPTTGRLGWAANYPVNQGPYTELGYPAQTLPGYPFDGEEMWQSVGDYVSGTNIIRACGNMSGGCSGGPWAIFRDNVWRVNGLNSHRPGGDNDHIHSPYFGQNFLNMLDWINNNGGNCT